MPDRKLDERARGIEAQREFRNAGNANVTRQAGEGIESVSNATPVPSDRLSGAEDRAEAGRRSDQGDSVRPRRQTDDEAKAEEREAIRRQGQNETDSDLDSESRPDAATALEDPVITSNPD